MKRPSVASAEMTIMGSWNSLDTKTPHFLSISSLWPRKKAETTTTGDILQMLAAREGLAGDLLAWREIWGLAGDQGLWWEISRHLAGGGNAESHFCTQSGFLYQTTRREL
jgi:hypothetical protein